VKLKDALVDNLQWVTEGECELAYVYGQFQVKSDEPMALLSEVPAALVPGHQAVYVGEVKLPEIRTVMQRATMQAELAQVRCAKRKFTTLLTTRKGHLACESSTSD